MRYGILSMLAIAALAFAQESKPKDVVQPEPEHKVFVLKYADAMDVGNLLSQVFGKGMSFNRDMKVIAVSGTAAMIAGVGEAIARLDVPPQPVKNIEITGYLLVGSTKAEAGASVPAELESVVKQVRANFPYKAFQLMDTMMLRVQGESKHASVNGAVAPSDGDMTNISYQLKVQSLSLTGEDKDTTIHLGGLELTMKVMRPNVKQDTAIISDVDIRGGQKVVVGKSSFGSPDKALFLVLTAKLVE